jgi:hypothetical protein
LIAHLESDALRRPACVTSSSHVGGPEDAGLVTSTIVRGELFLHPKGDPGSRLRLRWSEDDTDRARALRPGPYTVTGYRHVATAEDGAEWIWSTTSPGFAELEVKQGETTHFGVRTALGLKTRAFENKGKHRVGLAFQAEPRLGSTLYRAGRRIAIRWQLLDDEGTVLSDGPMRYG